jgi:hypothetical protein
MKVNPASAATITDRVAHEFSRIRFVDTDAVLDCDVDGYGVTHPI